MGEPNSIQAETSQPAPTGDTSTVAQPAPTADTSTAIVAQPTTRGRILITPEKIETFLTAVERTGDFKSGVAATAPKTWVGGRTNLPRYRTWLDRYNTDLEFRQAVEDAKKRACGKIVSTLRDRMDTPDR